MGGVTAVETPNSVETSFTFGQELPTARADFEKFVPEEYQKEEWVKNIAKSENPKQQLFEQFKNMQSKFGERQTAAVPADDAPPEVKKAFYKALGVPDTAEGYEIQPIAWDEADKELGAKIEASRDPALMGELKKAALAEGIAPKQLQKLIETHDKIVLQQSKQSESKIKEQVTQYDADFERMMRDKHGSKLEAVRENAKRLIKESGDKDAVAWLGSVDNVTLSLVASALDSFTKKYMREDGYTGAGASGVAASSSSREEGRRLMASEAYSNVLHAEHKSTVSRVQHIYGTNQKG